MQVKHGREVIAKPNEMAECTHYHAELPARLTVWLSNAYFAGDSFSLADQLLFEPKIEFVAINFNVPALWLIWRELTLPRSSRWNVGDGILLHTRLHGHQVRPKAISIRFCRCEAKRVFAVSDGFGMFVVVIRFANVTDEEMNLPRVRFLQVIKANGPVVLQKRKPDAQVGSFTYFQRALC